ncbi:MAG: hypothetical protein JRG67_14590 [Deltaproteobacteria bacterium]|nr:hypothetical protein [Deltaproteobacteria bacterium]
MRYSTHLVSLKVLGLAFAVLLCPMIMGQDAPSCTGDASLAALEFRPFQMPGQTLPTDLLGFEHDLSMYRIELPDSVKQAMLIAEPTDPSAEVVVNCYVGTKFVAAHMMDPGLGWFVIDLPEGNSTVRVNVSAMGGAQGVYNIDVLRI